MGSWQLLPVQIGWRPASGWRAPRDLTEASSCIELVGLLVFSVQLCTACFGDSTSRDQVDVPDRGTLGNGGEYEHDHVVELHDAG